MTAKKSPATGDVLLAFLRYGFDAWMTVVIQKTGLAGALIQVNDDGTPEFIAPVLWGQDGWTSSYNAAANDADFQSEETER